MKPTLWLVTASLFLALPGCGTIGNIFGGGDDSPVDLGSVGPSMKEVLRGLPKDLVGDADNKLYGFDELRPPPEPDPL
ncbi:MAG: hypothetical protein AAF337_10005 [Pseudomonadota bacterium]